MHERTRLSYLEALGVVSWAPREPLPNAAPSPLASPGEPESAGARMGEEAPAQIAVPPEQARPREPVAPLLDAGDAAATIAASAPVVAPSAPAVPSTPPPQPASPALAPFYLQLWLAGPCALLLQISEPGLEKATAPYRLLCDILRAAGLPATPVLFADFQWPLTRNPQFDRSALAASQALTAFVQARLEDQAVVSIGCLGERCVLLADAAPEAAGHLSGREEAVEGLAPVWFAASLEVLLASASEKAKLWRLLKRVMPRWKERK